MRSPRTLSWVPQKIKPPPDMYETGERADSSVVSAGGGQPAHRGSTPVGSNPGVARGYFPIGVLGLLWCECGCVCVCKPRQARPRTSRQLICVERTVSVGAQLSSYLILQCSWVLSKKKEFAMSNLQGK